MAKLVCGYGVNVYRAGVRIQPRVAYREAKAVGGFSVELNVIVQDRSSFVETSGEFDIAVAIHIGGYCDASGDVRISIPVNVISGRKIHIRGQAGRGRDRDRREAGGGAETQFVDEVEPGQPRIGGRP